MKRLFAVSAIVGLLMMGASISWAETTVKSGKSNSSDRVGGSGKAKGKAAKSTVASETQDPCASVKNDPTKYAKCQNATQPIGLKKITESGKRY